MEAKGTLRPGRWVGLLAGLVVAGVPAWAGAQETPDPCDQVTCSGHGRCVLLERGPTCACDVGYRADPYNGLACLPMPRLPATQIPFPADNEGQRDHLETVLRRDMSRMYASFLDEGEPGPTGRAFVDYVQQKYQAQRTGMAIMTLLGTALFWTPMMALVIRSDHREDDQMTDAESGVSAICAAGGIVTLITGAIQWASANRVLRRIRAVDQAAGRFGGVSLLDVAPIRVRGSDGFGLAAQFRF